MQIPELRLRRWAKARIEESKSGKETFKFEGMDASGGPFTLFKKTFINGNQGTFANLSEAQMKAGATIKVQMEFQGHYNESNLEVEIPRDLIKANGNQIDIN